AARACAFDVEPVSTDVDHAAGGRWGARRRGRADGREATADGEDKERRNHRDDEPAASATEMAANLDDHPDGQDCEDRRPDPTQKVHDSRAWLEDDQA